MTNSEYAESLRKLADLFEEHQELPIPHDAKRFDYFSAHTRAELAVVAKALGNCAKSYDEAFTGSVEVKAMVGHIQFRAIANRSLVCTARVVGHKHIEEKVIPAQPERVVPAHDEDVIEWDCKPILEEGAA